MRNTYPNHMPWIGFPCWTDQKQYNMSLGRSRVHMEKGIMRLWLKTSGRDLNHLQRTHAETGPRQWLKTRCYDLTLSLVGQISCNFGISWDGKCVVLQPVNHAPRPRLVHGRSCCKPLPSWMPRSERIVAIGAPRTWRGRAEDGGSVRRVSCLALKSSVKKGSKFHCIILAAPKELADSGEWWLVFWCIKLSIIQKKGGMP